MPTGFQGPNVRLLPLDRQRHSEVMAAWRSDPEICQFLAGGYRLYDTAKVSEFFDHIESASDEIHFAIETHDGEPIGWTATKDLDFRLGHAETLSLIGCAEHRGKGFGVEAAHLRAYYAFDILGLRILYSEHYPYNHASGRMLEAVGAEVWGVKPEANFKHGQYTDVICTYLRREAWRRPDWLPVAEIESRGSKL